MATGRMSSCEPTVSACHLTRVFSGGLAYGPLAGRGNERSVGPPLLLRDTLVKENEVVFRTSAKCCFTLWAQEACFAKRIRWTLPLT